VFNNCAPRELSVAVKAGQVLLCGFPTPDPARAKELIQDLYVGGIVYFSHNLGTVDEVRELSLCLQSYAQASPTGWPLLLAIDQEGGTVSRLTKDVPRWPCAMAVSAASLGVGDATLARRVYYAMGRELAAAGIHANFAPVLDVNDSPENPVIGVRSFGDDPSWVGELGVMAMRGLTDAGVLGIGKHFPGHGNASEDSHAVLPAVTRGVDMLAKTELEPFRRTVAAGLNGLMTAHVVYPALDPINPATLSATIIGKVLRQQLQFQGLLVTDCLEMSAIAKGVGTARGAVQALKAGSDMVLVSHSLELQRATHQAICAAVSSGELPAHRLDEAVCRIAAAKAQWCTSAPRPLSEAERTAFAALRETVFGAAITVVADRQALLPLADSLGARVLVASDEGLLHSARETLLQHLRCGVGDVRAVEHMEDATAVVLVRNLAVDAVQSRTVREIARGHQRTIVVALGSPYDLAHIPAHTTRICTYNADSHSLRALAAILLGRQTALGKLPIQLQI